MISYDYERPIKKLFYNLKKYSDIDSIIINFVVTFVNIPYY